MDEEYQNFDDIYKLEYSILKKDIIQLKEWQISLLTTSASITGLILTLMFYVYNSDFLESIRDINHEFLFLIPLILTIPSMILCFHKATLISRDSAYCKILSDFLVIKRRSLVYSGYDNYLYELNKSDKFTSPIEIKNIFRRILDWFSILFEIILLNKKNRLWSTLFYSYSGLILICLFVPFYLICCKNGLVLINGESAASKVLSFILLFTASLTPLVAYLIGKTLEKPYTYWNLIFVIPYFILALLLPFFSKAVSNLLSIPCSDNVLVMIFFSLIIIVFFCFLYNGIKSRIDKLPQKSIIAAYNLCVNKLNNMNYGFHVEEKTDTNNIKNFKISILGLSIITKSIIRNSLLNTIKQLIPLYIFLIFIISLIILLEKTGDFFYLIIFFALYCSLGTIVWSFLKVWSLKGGSDSIRSYESKWFKIMTDLDNRKIMQLPQQKLELEGE